MAKYLDFSGLETLWTKIKAKITAAIQALDVSSVGGDGKYISAISENDGKISATATTMDTTPTANSKKAVTSGGIKTALDGKSSTSHTHKVKINGTEKTIAATSGAAVDLGTYLTSHQNISGKADLANTLQTILAEPPQSDRNKYLIVSQTTFGETATYAWINFDLSMIIESRHSGTGLAVIQCNVNTSKPTEKSLTGSINIFTSNESVRIRNPLMMYRKYDASTYKWTITVVVNCDDGNKFKIKSILSRHGLIYSTSCSYVTDLTTLGTKIATAVTTSDSNHSHGNIANGGTLTDTAAAAAGNDYVVIRDADNSKIQTSTIKGTDVADAVSKKHSHSTLTLSTTAQEYDGTHTLALPSSDPYTSARTPSSHTHGNITNGGTITSDTTVASGDKIAIIDADNNKVARSGIAFDGSTTTTALTPKGTFETFSKLTIGTTSTTAAAGNHTHTTAIASDGSSGTVVTLAHNTQYKLTAGGTSVLFKTPACSNTDTKVTQTKDDSGTTAYPLLMAGAADPNGTATTARYDSGVKLTPSTNTISANISGNAATATNANITRTEDTANGDKLQIGTGTAVNITNAKHAASADTATNYASGGSIANALAGKASTSHAHDDRYIKASSGNKTLSFGGTTTIGTADGKNVNLVMPEANADTYEVYAGSTSFEDALTAFNADKKLLLKVGKLGNGSYSTEYHLPLYRVQFNGKDITQFVWMLDSDAYGDAAGSNTYGAIILYKLSESGWSSSSDNVDYAKAAGTAYGGVADYLKIQNYNEINFKNNSTHPQYKDQVWFNYRNGDDGYADEANQLKHYYFGNRNMGTDTTLHANRLAGSADKWNGWSIVVGSTGTDANTIYFV